MSAKKRVFAFRRVAGLAFAAALAPSAFAGMSTSGVFSVSETGAAIYNIPIEVPPGAVSQWHAEAR